MPAASASCSRRFIPQYCAATTATAVDAAFAALAAMRWQPALRTLPPYYDDPATSPRCKAISNGSSRRSIFDPELLLLSFHGMPQRTQDSAIPITTNARKPRGSWLAARIGSCDVTFQSRFGRAKWLEPATDTVLEAYAAKGTKRIAIAAPGFSADCLETLEELAIRGQGRLPGRRRKHFARLDCLNDSAESVALLERLVARELEGWRARP